jgi:hypothetical protein
MDVHGCSCSAAGQTEQGEQGVSLHDECGS